MKFVYTVWLRDTSFPPDDPAYEWPALYIIDGVTAESAKEWGDRLAESYARRAEQVFLSSAVEAVDASDLPGLETLPILAEGEEASDDKIGW